MENNRFSKKIFAILLERAKGDRSWRQFAIEADISYVQMRKLAQGTQENPPRTASTTSIWRTLCSPSG